MNYCYGKRHRLARALLGRKMRSVHWIEVDEIPHLPQRFGEWFLPSALAYVELDVCGCSDPKYLEIGSAGMAD